MTEQAAALDLLPLAFFTALVVYALAMGSADLARTLLRIGALLCAALCLSIWGAAALSYEDWGAPVIDEFYARAIVERQLGAARTGWLLLALSLVPAGFALRGVWRRRSAG